MSDHSRVRQSSPGSRATTGRAERGQTRAIGSDQAQAISTFEVLERHVSPVGRPVGELAECVVSRTRAAPSAFISYSVWYGPMSAVVVQFGASEKEQSSRAEENRILVPWGDHLCPEIKTEEPRAPGRYGPELSGASSAPRSEISGGGIRVATTHTSGHSRDLAVAERSTRIAARSTIS